MPKRTISGGIQYITKVGSWKSFTHYHANSGDALLVDNFEDGLTNWTGTDCTLAEETTVIPLFGTTSMKVTITDVNANIEYDFTSKDLTDYEGRGRIWVLSPASFTMKSRLEDTSNETLSGTSYAISDSGTATSGGDDTLIDTGATWTSGEHRDRWVFITGGTGSGQVRKIVINNVTTLKTTTDWTTNPDSTSTYVVSEWQRVNIDQDTDSGSFDESVSELMRFYDLPTSGTLYIKNASNVTTTKSASSWRTINFTTTFPTRTSGTVTFYDADTSTPIVGFTDLSLPLTNYDIYSLGKKNIYLIITLRSDEYPNVKPSVTSYELTWKPNRLHDAHEVESEFIYLKTDILS